MLTARSEHAASALPNHNVVVTGGFSPQGTILAQAEMYNPGNPASGPRLAT
jgi:hypothetical protein